MNDHAQASMEEDSILDFETASTLPRQQHPVEATSPPQLLPLSSHRLGFRAHSKIGFGGDNLIILACEDTKEFHLMQLEDDHFKEIWRKPCPREARCGDNKFIVENSIITRAGRDPTQCWNLDLLLLHKHELGRHREVVACFGSHIMIHTWVPRSPSKLINTSLTICDGNTEVMTLTLPGGSSAANCISVCQHPSLRWFAVCEWGSQSLDIFDVAGIHRYHINLLHPPAACQAICCTDSYILIWEDLATILHVYSWSGYKIGTVDLRLMLNLNGQENESVRSVGVCNGDVLLVAAGDLNNVNSLHALRLQ